MSEHKIHEKLPPGFYYANAQQADWFVTHGHVRGARKVVQVRSRVQDIYGRTLDPTATDLAVRLGPPKLFANVGDLPKRAADSLGIPEDERVKWYEDQYNLGWSAASRGTDSKAWNSGTTNHAWDDGYLDAAAGRPKWHLAHCIDHDECGEG